MPKQEKCPRCHQLFLCNKNDITACQCHQITLSAEQLKMIEINYHGCLCISCLLQLQKDTAEPDGL